MIDFTNPAAVIAAYKARYSPQNQGPTSCCLWADWTAAAQMWSLVRGTPFPQLSWPYSAYACTQDPTFAHGFDTLAAGAKLMEHGFCEDALYPQNTVLAHWQNGAPYPAEYLPSPAAYANGRSRRLLRFGNVRMSATVPGAVDFDEMVQLLRMGTGLVYSTYSHSLYILPTPPKDNYWFYVFDSLIADQDPHGLGLGVRYLARDQLQWFAFYVQEIETPPIHVIPSGDTVVTPAQIVAAIVANAPWSAADYAALQSAVATAAPAVVPPITGIYLTQGATLTDMFGTKWTFGAEPNRDGELLLANGRAQRRAKLAALVGGKMRALDAGVWYEKSDGDVYASPWAWTVVSAP